MKATYVATIGLETDMKAEEVGEEGAAEGDCTGADEDALMDELVADNMCKSNKVFQTFDTSMEISD